MQLGSLYQKGFYSNNEENFFRFLFLLNNKSKVVGRDFVKGLSFLVFPRFGLVLSFDSKIGTKVSKTWHSLSKVALLLSEYPQFSLNLLEKISQVKLTLCVRCF